jgi:hypothetical protein
MLPSSNKKEAIAFGYFKVFLGVFVQNKLLASARNEPTTSSMAC